jgi:predicted NBD/HSP70 family sugar kinase
MKVMVFDVGGTGIKYSVMDEQLNRTDTGSTPTPADSQEHFLNTLREIYLPHKDEVDGIALSLPGFIDAERGVVKGGGALAGLQCGHACGPPAGRGLRLPCLDRE